MSRRAAWLALLAAAALAGCAAKKTPTYATPDYPSWRRTTDVSLIYPIPGHQNRLRIPRMNAVGFTVSPTLEGGKRHWSFPEGTIIVKEVYETPTPAAGEAPVQLTVMVKASEDPRSRGGWLWITRELPAGSETVYVGNFCITCHSNANEKHPYGDRNPREEFRDYVYFVPDAPAPFEADEYSVK